MDKHTLELLEYDKVRAIVASYAGSTLGKELASELQPLVDADAIELELRLTTEMVEALQAKLTPPLGGLRDVRQPVKRAQLGVLLEIDQLLDIRDVLDLTGRAFDYALRLGPDYPALEKLLSVVQDQRHLTHAIDAAIDSRGAVRDSAAPELAGIRQQIHAYEQRIQAEIRKLLRNPDIREALRYPSSTVSGDHHVLPVAVNHRHKVVGVVHRTSSSGETVYIEPARVAELNAEISVLRSAEQREIRKVLRRLTSRIGQEAEQLLKSLQVLAKLDLVYAKARWSDDFRMTAPQISRNRRLRLASARHPLLEHLFRQERQQKAAKPAAGEETPERKVVPITVHLGGEFDMLVVTGPNTGGKTVALKTIGLLCLMAQSGLHIPAQAGSQVPLLSNVLADIGDEQSLEQSLSTFSAHITRIAEILRNCNETSLVLLDELGAGTDPTEGAALGRAILDELAENRCLAMVTTHLGDLKTYAFTQERTENAAVEFDVETLQPTYRLLIGQYGESCALKIARRLQLPRPLIQRAHKYVRQRGGRGGGQIRDLQEKRQQAEQAREEALLAQAQAAQAAREYQRKADLLQQEAEIREQLERFRSSLKPGDRVRVNRFDKSGTVVRVDPRKKQAAVTVGAVEWELSLDELLPCLTTPDSR